MDDSTIQLSSPSEFRQTFTNLFDHLDSLIGRAFANSELSTCCWESPETRLGACDSGRFSCQQKATVHHLESEEEYCGAHFADVERG